MKMRLYQRDETKRTLFRNCFAVLLGALMFILQTQPLGAGIVPEDCAEPVVDSLYTSLVREYTTDKMFLSPLVEHLPDHPVVPSPREFLGYIAGTPKKLTYYADIKAYMEKLAEASPRIRLFPMGKSNEGREMIVVIIADEHTLNDLERYADYTGQLADPRRTGADEAEAIIQRAKPFYYITGGLHSTETGSPDMLMELAYRLAVGESRLIRRIREQIITMITPVLETDGRERTVDWYYKYTVDHTDWEDMPPRTPPYWGKYIFHDNNRDGIQLSQPLSKHFARFFFRYHPQITLDLHESIPLLYVSSGTGPYNDALDPITTSEWQWISNYEVSELTKMGMPGVWTWGFYTGWYPGYLLWFANNHNSLGRFYETFGNSGASTFDRKLEEVFADRKVTSRQWYRPWPPEKKIKWSFRNNTNYMETGVLTSLHFAAENAKTLLYNFWKKGKNAVERGQNEAPHAWIIPREHQNAFELSYLINNLLWQGIEVHMLDERFSTGEESFSKGSFVIRMDQPYRNFAKSLLEEQQFPKDAVYDPYDDIAWTLPLLYGLSVKAIDDQSIFKMAMSSVKGFIRISGRRPKKNDCYLIPASTTQKLLEARFHLKDFDVFAADTSFRAQGRSYPRGSWIIPAGNRRDDLFKALTYVADSVSLDVFSSSKVPQVPMHSLDIPRIALFHTWTFTQDSGWIRYTLDRAGIPYALIDKDDLREGDLRRRLDVIIIPNLGGWFKLRHLIQGIDAKWAPMPYEPSSEFPNIGRVDRTPDLTGGMGFLGLANLERFVLSGGTLITFGSGGLIPVELGLVRYINQVSPPGFRTPGSVVRVRVTNPKSNLVCGYDTVSTVFRGRLPLFDVMKKHKHLTVLQYGTRIPDENEESVAADDAKGRSGDSRSRDETNAEGCICVSGFVKGEEHLEGKPAVLDIPRGDGRVIIFSFKPLHRYLTHASFALAYNAILHWNDR